MILYYGSNMVVEHPKILTNGFYKDFGYGFYCTVLEKWLQFVVDCRRGIAHPYDIVERPMADDTIWDYIEDYMSGAISKAAFWELVKFKYPTHQIVFCSEKSLQTLEFEGSYLV